MGVCAKHWPENFETKTAKGGHLIPNSPLSIFDVIPRRNVTARKVTAESRNMLSDELFEFNQIDKIHDFKSFKQGLILRNYPIDIILKDDYVIILSITDCLDINFVIKVSSDFSITAKKSNSCITILRTMLGFQHRLERWSQLDNVMSFLKNYDCDFITQFSSFIETINITDLNEETKILLDLVKLAETEPNGRRYNASIIMKSLTLYVSNKQD